MIHYSCDRCGCAISEEQTIRYVVRIEMEAKLNFEDDDIIDEDRDVMLEMDQMLEELEDEMIDDDHLMVHQRKVFDLCPSCFRKFSKNPVGRERISPFGFSHN